MIDIWIGYIKIRLLSENNSYISQIWDWFAISIQVYYHIIVSQWLWLPSLGEIMLCLEYINREKEETDALKSELIFKPSKNTGSREKTK